VRTEFRLRLPEPINKSSLESRGPTLLCNQVGYKPKFQISLGFRTFSDIKSDYLLRASPFKIFSVWYDTIFPASAE
jgi:hypothetical protein